MENKTNSIYLGEEEIKINSIYLLNKEIVQLQEQLNNLTFSIISPSYEDDIKSKNKINDCLANYVAEKMYLEDYLKCKLQKLYIEIKKIECFIDSFNEPRDRLIFRLRLINNLSWEQIGLEVNYSKDGCRKRFYRILKNVNTKEKKDV